MFKKLALSMLAVFALAGAAVAGYWAPNWPAFNTAANTVCASAGNNGVCNQYTPAGTTSLTGAEAFPVDTNYGYQPFQQTISLNYFGQAFGTARVLSTTGTTASVVFGNSENALIYTGAGVATWTAVTLPAAPIANAKACIYNSSASVLTLTAINAPTGYTIGTPAVASATLAATTNNAAAAAETSTCYQLVGTVWYKVV